jgi:hypothetical protein
MAVCTPQSEWFYIDPKGLLSGKEIDQAHKGRESPSPHLLFT